MPSSDILIIGGGLAGLFCALKLSPRPVTILATSPIGTGASSVWAQGGIAAAMSDGDSAASHVADTMAAGAGIVDRDVATGMAQEAADRIHDLLAYGVPFDRDLEGRLVQSREAAHSERRIVRVKGDAAGAAIMQALVAAVRATPSITIIEDATAEELIVHERHVLGVIARRGDGTRAKFAGAAVVLATGGIGQLYRVTTNPVESRGLGLAIAARAGAVIADVEFVQFHPTAIDIGRDPAPLATEALRGDGATLINRDGQRFMRAIHPDAELAPRDIVARGVFAEVAAGRGAFLDAREAIGAGFAEHFPTVYAICKSAGIDPSVTPIPVVPAEHYHMGGVWTDARGRTSLQGLWAAGEVASTGVHGANRLASNSLLEAVVFAARIAEDLAAIPAMDRILFGAFLRAPLVQTDDPGDSARVALLRDAMARDAGVLRDGEGLARTLKILTGIARETPSLTTSLMATSAICICAAALVRHESRGGHFRTDFPEADPALARRSNLTLAKVTEIVDRAIS